MIYNITDYNWVKPSEVIKFHSAIDDVKVRGVRDIGLLESALDSPKNNYQYNKHSIEMLSALYIHRLAMDHAFFDGNKRTALVTGMFFLAKNYHYFMPIDDQDYLAETIENVAKNMVSVEELCAIITPLIVEL